MAQSPKLKAEYFNNLDGLRGIAALCVIFGHCQSWIFEQIKVDVYVPWGYKLAGFGVDLFFVLSGFLISFNLLTEIKTTGVLQVKKFYIRRILRLWPLYFLFAILVIIFGTPLAVGLNYTKEVQTPHEMLVNFICMSTFSINLMTLFHAGNTYTSAFLGHYWSLAAEEQFYLFFAPALNYFRKHILAFLVSIITIGFFFNEIYVHRFTDQEDANYFSYYFTLSRFFHFGIGGVMAWAYVNGKFKTQNNLTIWEKYLLQVCFLVPTYLFICGGDLYLTPTIKLVLNHLRTILAILSAGIILCAIMKNSIFLFERGFLKYCGKISFGMYIFHLLALRLSAYILQTDPLFVSVNSEFFTWAFPILTTLISVLFATLSYKYFEKPFLNLKKNFR